jgi:serine protease AprX
LLESTAKDWGAPGKDYEWGSGVVDGLAFVAQAGGDTTSALSYPTHEYVTGSVGNNGSWTHQFTVTDLSVPIAATVIINGQRKCIRTFFGCAYEWSPDLDVEIRDPNGQQIALSECAAGLECGYGRQETPHAMPTVIGVYTLRVYPFSGSPNNGKGGSFAVDVAYGPVVASPPPPPSPPPGTNVHVGDLDATTSSAKNTWGTTVTIRVHTAAEAPQAGAVVTAHWTGGTSVQCTTDASGACSVGRSGLSKRQTSITLTVDNVSASGATYDAAANHDPDGDSNGTSISVAKP